MESLQYTGGCLCSAVRYAVRGPLRHLCYCHCLSCRRAAGAAPVAWGTVSLAQLCITRGALTEYRSSAPVVRGFCAACGSSISYRHAGRSQDIDLALVTLDDAGAFVPQAHVWVADKLPWVQIADGLPQHQAGFPQSA